MISRTLRAFPNAASAAVVAVIGLSASSLLAAPPVRYVSAPSGHTVVVDGTSNVHDWSAKSNQVNGWVELPGQWVEQDGELRLEPSLKASDAQPQIQVQIPVRTLKSGRDGLDDNMYKAMEASKHRNVEFVLDSITAVEGDGQGPTVWDAKGRLTIAGTERKLSLKINVTPLPDGRMEISVDRAMKMSDFGIDPPTAMLGMARAADRVDVDVTWILERQTPQPSLPADDSSAEHQQGVLEVVKAYDRARAVLSAGDTATVASALDELAAAADALRSIDAQGLDEAVQTQWEQAVPRLQGAARNAEQAKTLGSARASFAVLSQALPDVVKLVGFGDEPPLLGYRLPDKGGLEGAIWYQISNPDEPTAASTPYVTGDQAATPEVTAMYLGERPEMP